MVRAVKLLIPNIVVKCGIVMHDELLATNFYSLLLHFVISENVCINGNGDVLHSRRISILE